MISEIKVVEFKAEHMIENLKEEQSLMGVEVDKMTYAKLFEQYGHAVSLVTGMGQVLGSGGIMPLSNGTAEVWTTLSEECKKYPVALFRACKTMIQEIQKKYRYRRIQMNTKTKKECDFAEALGFIYEGPLFGFGRNGETCRRYALWTR